ncbi:MULTISPECIES: conjugative transposon protein TraN [Chryseobacterium group]|jgi:conjugative transposon TraN protein|uniref:Conjugative transposon protein TraN n=4 Tax=Chryseobacterium TaxID=59732 RepID=A0AAJ1VKP3_9FLAO|nr:MULTISPECIES: conjugative transposon protein TraN [Chryseobacterium group]EFK33184.1 conjugative transposon TraN protein [Chryseobacterium gleum ATCC 35910]MDN4013276.1 conjugative transposon protein TraN [Chryseobacterium gambrini]MDN4028870.1 conjugative transposon protein TraN [Chryseobacterium gambrini]MDO3425164.1 conjugative transposon protein TraN [Chryseobacterium sp. APV1]QQY33993.1 conjugative transposon protein TraN [Chryseobacterium gleum]
MKNFIIILMLMLVSTETSAQNTVLSRVYKNNLPEIYITGNVNLHFRSPQPIQFVDLSTKHLIGDLPTENVVRIKIQQFEEESHSATDSIRIKEETPIYYYDNQELGIVTIVGQSFMAQYKLIYKVDSSATIMTNIEILPEDMQALEYPDYQMSSAELRKYSVEIIRKKEANKIRRNRDLGIESQLNNVYAFGDYVFLDISFKNNTNLIYDIDKLKFSIDDKKVYKATNVQSIEIEPVFRLYDLKTFKKSYRNIFVFKKFTYPNNKVLNIRLIENQISGRTINLEIKYSDILQADTF